MKYETMYAAYHKMLLDFLFKINYIKSVNNYLSMLHIASCHYIWGEHIFEDFIIQIYNTLV